MWLAAKDGNAMMTVHGEGRRSDTHPMTLDDEIGERGAVGGLEEPRGACHIEQNVGAHHGIRPLAAVRALLLLIRRPSGRGDRDGGALPEGGSAAAARSGSEGG